MAIIKWIIAFRVVRKLPRRDVGGPGQTALHPHGAAAAAHPGSERVGSSSSRTPPRPMMDLWKGDAMKWDMGV
jgi:hypothetical protein